MKLFGDVSERDRELAEELDRLEADITSEVNIGKDIVAKACVCLAHDWYLMGVDEEGNRLLEKAEKYFPGYFKELMIKQTLEDPRFDYLVKGLTSELAMIILYRLKENKR